jgi:acyl carrier protein
MSSSDRTQIRLFVTELLRDHDDSNGFTDDESLVKSGRLDSLSVVKLVSFLETKFGVDFTRVEFEPDRFDSVAEIEGVIEEARAL